MHNNTNMPNMKQQHTLKPLLKVGDDVTAAWWPPSADIEEAAPSGWYRGVISSYKTAYPTQKSNSCYGPVRYYSVNFDDGDVGRDIPEHFVFLRDEYDIMTGLNEDNNDNDNDEEIVWKGVKTVTDRQSDDPWAKHVGWYVATIDGQDHTFSLLSDALRAYDSFVVSKKGVKTLKREDLNLPELWEKLFRDKAKGEKHKLEVEELKERHDEDMDKMREKAEADKESAVRMAVVKEERKVRELQHQVKIEVKEQSKKEMEKLKRQYEQENVKRKEEEAKFEKQKLKPRYQVGEEVYAAWWPDSNKDEPPLWYPGHVKSYKDQRVSSKGVGEYGVVRLYKIQYTDDGSEQDHIPEHFVFQKEDYLLSTSNSPQHEWKGVKNVVDKDSDDVWASLIGYYVAIIDGAEQSFPCLSEALQAYDASIVKRKGDNTKQSDLNIPENWEWVFSPNAEASPSVDELMDELHQTRLKITEQEKQDTEKELAAKTALEEERRRTQEMKRKLRKKLTEYHETEMKRALQKFEEDKTEAIEKVKVKARKEHELALEQQRGDLEQHFNYEKDKAMQFVKLETRQQQKDEMQAEFNNLKKEIEKEIEQRLMSEYSLPPPTKRAKISLSLVPRSAFGLSSPQPTVQKGKENVPEGDSLLTPPSEKKSAEEGEILV